MPSEDFQIHFWNINNIDSPKNANKHKLAIYKEICRVGEAKRRDLSSFLDVSNATISSLVQELIDVDLIKEKKKKIKKKRGRPDSVLIPNFSKYSGIAIYVKDMSLIFSLIDIAGNTIHSFKENIPADTNNEELIKLLYKKISALKRYSAENTTIIGVAMMFVGTVDKDSVTWVDAFRWPKIKNLCFKALGYDLNLKICVHRILNAELKYQIEVNDKLRKDCGLLYFWGYGVGAAYSYRGHILESNYGRFSDVGHTIVDPNSKRKCRCGKSGCVEAEASLRDIIPDLEKIYPEVNNSFEDLLKVIALPRIINEKIISHAIDIISYSISNLLLILYPDHLFLIGPYFQNPKIKTRLLEKLNEKIGPHHKKIDMIFINEGHHRCQWGGLIDLFHSRITEDIESF